MLLCPFVAPLIHLKAFTLHANTQPVIQSGCSDLTECHREVHVSLTGEGETQAVFTYAVDQVSNSQTSKPLI